MDLHGKAALVTGGASGIGAEAARRLAAGGARVAIADRDEAGARALADELGGLALPGDVAQPDTMTMAVDIAEDTFGRLDVVLLNAGITAGQSGLEDLDLAGYRRIMGVNVDHVVFGLTAAVPALRRARRRRDRRDGLAGGLTAMPGDALYTLSKHAVVGYVRAAAPGAGQGGHPRQRRVPGFRRHTAARARQEPAGGLPAAHALGRGRRRSPPSWSAASRGSAGTSSRAASPRPTASAECPGRRARRRPRPSAGRTTDARVAGARARRPGRRADLDRDRPTPSRAPGQVLVRVHAVACNFPDILLCQGRYQEKPALPFTPGMEIAGEVVAAGPGAAAQVGDRVLGMPPMGGGGYAELALLDAASTLPWPEGMSAGQAAGMFVTYQTGVCALEHRGGLQEGETLLVHAAAGGVGSAAVQLGKALGARVIGTAGGPEKCAVATCDGSRRGRRLQERGPRRAGQGAHRRPRRRRHLRPGRRRPVRRLPPGGGVRGADPGDRLRRRAGSRTRPPTTRSSRTTRSSGCTGRCTAGWRPNGSRAGRGGSTTCGRPGRSRRWSGWSCRCGRRPRRCAASDPAGPRGRSCWFPA